MDKSKEAEREVWWREATHQLADFYWIIQEWSDIMTVLYNPQKADYELEKLIIIIFWETLG